jgi:hypothetical protein
LFIAKQYRKHVARVCSRIVAERRKSYLKLIQAPLTLEIAGVEKWNQNLRLEKRIGDLLRKLCVQRYISLVDEHFETRRL